MFLIFPYIGSLPSLLSTPLRVLPLRTSLSFFPESTLSLLCFSSPRFSASPSLLNFPSICLPHYPLFSPSLCLSHPPYTPSPLLIFHVCPSHYSLSLHPRSLLLFPPPYTPSTTTSPLVLYEMAALRPAFMAYSMESLMAKIKRGNHDRHLPRIYSPDLKRVLSLLLAVDPRARPTASELLENAYFADEVRRNDAYKSGTAAAPAPHVPDPIESRSSKPDILVIDDAGVSVSCQHVSARCAARAQYLVFRLGTSCFFKSSPDSVLAPLALFFTAPLLLPFLSFSRLLESYVLICSAPAYCTAFLSSCRSFTRPP